MDGDGAPPPPPPIDMDDPARLLPVELLADVLHRLAPRSLAASRCVCRAWRAVIDGHRLLRTDLLPLSLDGFFFSSKDPNPHIPGFFCRRSTARKVSNKLFDCLDPPDWNLTDHCNGLLLMFYHVVNPATRHWVPLPPRPPSCMVTECDYCIEDDYLVFDPAESPHFEVFLVPFVPLYHLPPGHISYNIYEDKSVTAMMQSEWPPSPYIVQAFSSRTGQWKKRSFVREGVAAGTIADIQSGSESGNQRAAYWHGALYVQCQNNFVLRMNLSNDKCQVMNMPNVKRGFTIPYLGKSKNGVYYASVYDMCAFQIWFLDESCGQMEWVLKHDINLSHVPANFCQNYGVGPWISCEDDNSESLVEDNFKWDSDSDNVFGTDDWVEMHHSEIDCLGFHPYKEIVFFFIPNERAVAYHLNSSKIQDLGEMCIPYSGLHDRDGIDLSLPYTPCWMELPRYN